MAKSIRSKFKRQMRNVKRERNAVRELERIKRVTAAFSLPKLVDAEMVSVERPLLYTVPKSRPLGAEGAEAPEKMEEEKKFRDPVTLKDSEGQYPSWMNQRTIRKRKIAAKLTKKKGKGKGKGKQSW